MQTKHRRAVARIIALIAVFVFALTLPAFAGSGTFKNGLGSYSTSTTRSSGNTTVTPGGMHIYATASITTYFLFYEPVYPYTSREVSASANRPPAKSTASCTTYASTAGSSARIPSNWYVISARSTHSGSANDEYGGNDQIPVQDRTTYA